MSTYDNTGLERGSSERPGRSAPTKNQPKRSAPSVISAHPASKGKPAGSRKAPGQRPDEPGSPPGQVEVSALSEAEKEAIQKRAEGRTKVPPRFRDSIKRFFFSPTGALKLLRLGLLIAALACFIIAEAQESYIAITVLEIFIVILFILIYMLTLHHLLTYIHWPLLDLINSFITTVFLLIVATLTIQEKERRHLFYVGGVLCLVAAIVCLVDATLVTKLVRQAMKKALGLEGEATAPAAKEGSREPPKPEAEPEKMPSSSPSATADTASAKDAPPP